MRKSLLLLPLLLLSFCSKAQYTYTSGCIDSSAINPYFYCTGFPPNFDPVCGCDGKTYRNACAAANWAGVTYATPGICGDYFIDITPDVIIPGSTNNAYGILSIYTTTQVDAIIQIFDDFGRVWYVNHQTINVPYPIYFLYIYMDGFPHGIYYLTVIIGSEVQIRKIAKADFY